MEYFIGIDIGTTSAKSVAFSPEGKTLAEHSIPYPISHPHASWSEQDPDEILKAIVRTVEKILEILHPHIPAVCSFCSAMHSLIAVDQNGKAISPSIIWADNRAAEIAEQIHRENRAWQFYQRTGLPVHAMSPFCKLIWMKENQEELFNRAHKFLGIKEYIFFHLFGSYSIDVSMASSTGLMNAETLDWDPFILEQTGISAGRLSEITGINKIFKDSRVFPSLRDVPFVIGGSDGAMANLGASDEKGSLVVTVGTSSAARLILNKPYLDPGMRTFCYYIHDRRWLLGGASNNGGILLQWLQEEFFRAGSTVAEFLDQSSSVGPGANGLIFLPYLLGERAPIWNARAKGVLFGIDINHSQADMVKAALEAVIYCLYGISQPLFEQTNIENIYATGGFARNDRWLQILADVFNLPVRICDTVENSAWGAVKTGMQALGIQAVPGTTVTKSYLPDPSAHEIYRKRFEKFKRLYELLRDEFE